MSSVIGEQVQKANFLVALILLLLVDSKGDRRVCLLFHAFHILVKNNALLHIL